MLPGTIREQIAQQRRPFVKFFGCQKDLSHEPPETSLPDAVASAGGPFFVIGGIAGGYPMHRQCGIVVNAKARAVCSLVADYSWAAHEPIA